MTPGLTENLPAAKVDTFSSNWNLTACLSCPHNIDIGTDTTFLKNACCLYVEYNTKNKAFIVAFSLNWDEKSQDMHLWLANSFETGAL